MLNDISIIGFKALGYIFAPLLHMLRVKLLSFFLLLLITLQMLPIASIGRMLSQSQWTEELPHNDAEDGKTDGLAKFYHPYLSPANHSAVASLFSETVALAYIHSSEKIPFNHSAEVVTPPPDLFI